MKKIVIYILALLCIAGNLSARTLYVTRHAQKKGMPIKEIREPRITEDIGVRQSKNLADYMVNKIKFNGVIYASPFYRTTETAGYVARLLNTKVILEPGLQEVATHKKPTPAGMTLKQFEHYFPGMTVPGKRYADGWRVCKENTKMRLRRLEKTLDAILAETKGDVLLVTHGAGTAGLFKILNNRRANAKVKPMRGRSWNCALFIYELDDNNRVINTRYTTEFMADEDVTSNFRCPKIERPNDPRYMTKAQNAAYAAKRAKMLQAAEEAARKSKKGKK